jgi:hypothetical protein
MFQTHLVADEGKYEQIQGGYASAIWRIFALPGG